MKKEVLKQLVELSVMVAGFCLFLFCAWFVAICAGRV